MKNKIREIIFDLFRKTKCRENHIVMMRSINTTYYKLNPKEQDLFYVVINELITDGYFIYESASSGLECLRLTKKGYEKIYEDPISDSVESKEMATKVIESDKINKVVILTAIKEEYLAVRKHLSDLEDIESNDTHYEIGNFILEDKIIAKVVIRECGAKNNIASQETERAIQNFKPNVMFFVGIAGSRKPQDFAVGDVIFPEKIYSYEAGKSEENVFKSRPDLAESNYILYEIAKKERLKDDWKKLIKGSWDKTTINADLGVIASGEKLIEHNQSEIGKILLNHFNDTSAVEMEGFGFAKAVSRQGRQTNSILVGVVRGISDIISQSLEKQIENDNRPKEAKLKASDTAAAFTFWLIYKLSKK